MDWQSAPSYTIRLMISASAALFAFNSAFCAEEKKPTACNEDAMLVFDASGSMGGSVGLGVATPVTRIDKVRSALAEVFPSATRFSPRGSHHLWSGPLPTVQRQA